jgi:predicted aspartyl protease
MSEVLRNIGSVEAYHNADGLYVCGLTIASQGIEVETNFLVDTGANFSFISREEASKFLLTDANHLATFQGFQGIVAVDVRYLETDLMLRTSRGKKIKMPVSLVQFPGVGEDMSILGLDVLDNFDLRTQSTTRSGELLRVMKMIPRTDFEVLR